MMCLIKIYDHFLLTFVSLILSTNTANINEKSHLQATADYLMFQIMFGYFFNSFYFTWNINFPNP